MTETINGDRIRIELWGPVSPAFGVGLSRRGVLANDFDLDMTLRFNKNGVAIVAIADDNAYVPEIVKRDTNAVVFVDNVPVYGGHIEEQEIPLVPGGAIEFAIVDAWEMFLGGSLAWVNPSAVGQAEVRNGSGTLIHRSSPWSYGTLRPINQFDLGQCGLRDNLPVYPDPSVWSTMLGDTSLPLRLFPGGMESMGDSADRMVASFSGYWNPAHRTNNGVFFDRLHTEGSWLQRLVEINVTTRLGYGAGLLAPMGASSTLGKYVWYPETSITDRVAESPETWRYGPLLRFDVIEDAVEDFLDGVADTSIRASMRWDNATSKWKFIVDEPNDLTSRVLSVESGEITGGSAKLSKMPVTDVVIAGPGDFAKRAMDSTIDTERGDRFGWLREVFESASNATPVWEDSGGYNTPEVYRIPKYHHKVGDLTTNTRNAFRAQMQQAGIARMDEDRVRDSVSPVLQESEWFRFAPGTSDGYELGTRVAVAVPSIGVLEDRIRSIRIVLNARDGLRITPEIGDPAVDSDLSTPLARTTRNLGRMERAR